MPGDTAESNKSARSFRMAMVGGFVGGAVGTIIVQLICCWLCHKYQLPMR